MLKRVVDGKTLFMRKLQEEERTSWNAVDAMCILSAARSAGIKVYRAETVHDSLYFEVADVDAEKFDKIVAEQRAIKLGESL